MGEQLQKNRNGEKQDTQVDAQMDRHIPWKDSQTEACSSAGWDLGQFLLAA